MTNLLKPIRIYALSEWKRSTEAAEMVPQKKKKKEKNMIFAMNMYMLRTKIVRWQIAYLENTFSIDLGLALTNDKPSFSFN